MPDDDECYVASTRKWLDDDERYVASTQK